MTYMHEHLRIDLSGEKKDDDCLLDSYAAICSELQSLQARGLTRIVDVSCRGMGRDYAYIDTMEKDTGLEVIIATGYYKEPFFPTEVYEKTEKELTQLLLSDITSGCEGSNRKARLIGEIGTSKDCFTEHEKKVFRAAAAAQIETNIPITTHTTLGTMACEQVALLKSLGVQTNKIIIGHIALANNLDTILKVLDEGSYVEFDTIGKKAYLSDNTRADFIYECCKRGYEKQLLLSMDITRKSHLLENGGYGYAYLFDSFLPLLKEKGVTESHIHVMLTENPNTILH